MIACRIFCILSFILLGLLKFNNSPFRPIIICYFGKSPLFALDTYLLFASKYHGSSDDLAMVSDIKLHNHSKRLNH